MKPFYFHEAWDALSSFQLSETEAAEALGVSTERFRRWATDPDAGSKDIPADWGVRLGHYVREKGRALQDLAERIERSGDIFHDYDPQSGF